MWALVEKFTTRLTNPNPNLNTNPYPNPKFTTQPS